MKTKMIKLCFVLLLSACSSSPLLAATQLTVLLDWFINPDHGPLIVAKERGLFEEVGLEVKLEEPADPSLPPKLVAAGKADIAVSYQPQLHMQVDEGLPLVRFGTLVSTPLNSLVVLEDSPITSVADLKGKKVGFSVGGFEDALLKAMLTRHELTLDDVELVNVNWSLSPSLITKKVDAVIGAFRNFELNQMDIEGYPGRAFYVEEEGVPIYDELIYVANESSRGDPALGKFIEAVQAATVYIVNHPDEAWEIFKATNPDQLDNELNRRAWKDTLSRFSLQPAALDAGRYNRFAEFMLAQDLISSIPDLDTYTAVVH